MNDADIQDRPRKYAAIEAKSAEIGFTMPSDVYIGTLLKTLLAAKPGGRALELGTGIGLSLAWLIDGLTPGGHIISIDNDAKLCNIAGAFFADDPRVEIVCADGAEWMLDNPDQRFALIFADAWPGKYNHLDEALAMVEPGGFYVIDDMRPQPNWPEGHAAKAEQLIAYLESRADFSLTKMDWSTGVVVMAKKG